MKSLIHTMFTNRQAFPFSTRKKNISFKDNITDWFSDKSSYLIKWFIYSLINRIETAFVQIEWAHLLKSLFQNIIQCVTPHVCIAQTYVDKLPPDYQRSLHNYSSSFLVSKQFCISEYQICGFRHIHLWIHPAIMTKKKSKRKLQAKLTVSILYKFSTQ